jgi:hypothetical protein
MEYQKTYHFEDYEKHGDVSTKKLDKLVDQLLDISEGIASCFLSGSHISFLQTLIVAVL